MNIYLKMVTMMKKKIKRKRGPVRAKKVTYDGIKFASGLEKYMYMCLKKAKINTIGDLLQYSPEKLQELKNFGRKSADEVFSTLKNKLGIILK